MKKYLFFIIILFTISCSKSDQAGRSFLENAELPVPGKINATSLLIRNKPSTGAPVQGSISRGHRLDIIARTEKKETIEGKTGYWYKVKSASGISGYSFGGFISKPEVVDTIPVKTDEIMDCPDSINNSYKCAKYIEKKKLPLVSSKVSRDKDSLSIKCSENHSKTLADTDKSSTKVTLYSYLHYYKSPNQFLVHVHYYEATGFLLINGDNCHKKLLWDEPVFSPDRKHFICSSVDMEAGYNPNGIQLWSKEGNRYVKIFEDQLTWAAANPRWINNTTIEFTRYDGYPGHYMEFEAELKYNGNKWVLYE